MTTAPEILKAGIAHMENRAATYDKPEGERSMAATVEAFNAVTGDGLMNTEERGWLFMLLLKAVRSQQGAFRPDNYEDGAAYFGLAGEAASKSMRNAGQSHPMTPNVIEPKLNVSGPHYPHMKPPADEQPLKWETKIEPASLMDDDSPRMQAIGQNGNDGAVYSELDRLRAAAEFNDDIPVQTEKPLPGGHTWDEAPAGFNWIGRTSGGSLVWYNEERYRYVVNKTEHPFCPENYTIGQVEFIAERPSIPEPKRPRHVCATCAQGHATHECKAGQNETHITGTLAMKGWWSRNALRLREGILYDLLFEDGLIRRRLPAQECSYSQYSAAIAIRESIDDAGAGGER